MFSNRQFFLLMFVLMSLFGTCGYLFRDPKSYAVVTVDPLTHIDTATTCYLSRPPYEVGKTDSSKRLIVAIKPKR